MFVTQPARLRGEMLGFLDQTFSINTPFYPAPQPIPLISWSLSSCSRESTQLLLRFLPPPTHLWLRHEVPAGSSRMERPGEERQS